MHPQSFPHSGWSVSGRSHIWLSRCQMEGCVLRHLGTQCLQARKRRNELRNMRALMVQEVQGLSYLLPSISHTHTHTHTHTHKLLPVTFSSDVFLRGGASLVSATFDRFTFGKAFKIPWASIPLRHTLPTCLKYVRHSNCIHVLTINKTNNSMPPPISTAK